MPTESEFFRYLSNLQIAYLGNYYVFGMDVGSCKNKKNTCTLHIVYVLYHMYWTTYNTGEDY